MFYRMLWRGVYVRKDKNVIVIWRSSEHDYTNQKQRTYALTPAREKRLKSISKRVATFVTNQSNSWRLFHTR